MVRDVYKENAKCKLCGDKGFIIYTRKIEDITYDFVARCKCEKSYNFLAYKPYYLFGLNDSQIIQEKKKNLYKVKNMYGF